MKNRRLALLFFVLWIAGFALWAQEADALNPVIEEVGRDQSRDPAPKKSYLKEGYYDRVPRMREIPKVDAEAFPEMRDRYRSEEFDYGREVAQTNIWQRIQQRLSHWLESLMPDSRFFTFGEWFYKLLAMVAIVAVLLILYRVLFSGNRLLARSEKERDEDSEIRFVEKNLMDTNLAEYIARAEQSGDYALAVRYLNLRNIQLLARREIVRWKPAKANAELIEAIKDPDIKREFARCVRLFDRVWFGNTKLNNAKYGEYARYFSQFQTKWK